MAEVNFLVKKGLTVPKGSAATPAVIFDASDPNTGIYSPGADQVAISTSSTGRLFIDASGRVGAGTSAPGTNTSNNANQLVVGDNSAAAERGITIGSTTGGGIRFNDGADAGLIEYNHASNFMRFVVNGSTEAGRFDSSGRLGLGTSSPARLLSISDQDNASIRLTNTKLSAGTDQLFGAIEYEKSDASGAGAGVVGAVRVRSGNSIAGSAYMTFSTSSSSGNDVERVRIDPEGRVGVGTTSPNSSALLDVTSTTAGFLPPRMTTAQRDAISSPAAGLMVYNTSTNKLNFYNGSAWEAVTSA